MTAQRSTTQNDRQPLDRMLRRPEVEEITGRSRSAIYEGMAAGTFPKPVKIGARAVAWPESVIRQWIAERMEGGGA
jgi:prophage regulatory protein